MKKFKKQVYIADCIEHGDRFDTVFMSNETNKDKLYAMGRNEAAGWGGECISVKLIDETDSDYPEEEPYDADINE